MFQKLFLGPGPGLKFRIWIQDPRKNWKSFSPGSKRSFLKILDLGSVCPGTPSLTAVQTWESKSDSCSNLKIPSLRSHLLSLNLMLYMYMYMCIYRKVFQVDLRGYKIYWIYIYTSSTAQGGGGSFKNRKPIGAFGSCESRMAERSHWWTERCLKSPLFLSLSLTTYLPTYLCIYLSIYLSIYPSIYLSIYLSYLETPSILNLTTSKTKQFCETSSVFWTRQHQKRSNSARLPSMFELDNVKNEAILRDVLNFWTW